MKGFWWDRLATTGGALAGAAGVGCTLGALRHPLPVWSVPLPVAAALYLSVCLVGAAIARADRRNPVGWLLMSSGIALPAGGAAYLLASAQYQRTGTVGWAGWWDGWPWVPAQGLLPVVGLLL